MNEQHEKLGNRSEKSASDNKSAPDSTSSSKSKEISPEQIDVSADILEEAEMTSHAS